MAAIDNPAIRNLLISPISTSNRLPLNTTPDSRRYNATVLACN